ncbi:MAG: phage integrase N-terminal SAM-like domain-containing protein [Rhodoferax sp.]|nr:phage integrase N-terminal SAM-like domain-containing protein [Rhodoferax sp.]MBP7493506.1 phage integrase N-terminal SAM-like domain-containing protein [Rhodoferax sp.]
MKPVSYIPQSARLLDQLREVLRYKHYSLRTEEADLYWVKFFVRWHGHNGPLRHPQSGVECFVIFVPRVLGRAVTVGG